MLSLKVTFVLDSSGFKVVGKKWHFPIDSQAKVETSQSFRAPSCNSLSQVFTLHEGVTMKCIHCATERFVIHFWKALFKVEDRDDVDNEHVNFHATKPSCMQKLIHLYFDYLFFLHTFVVLVYSLRTVDLTRNMTEEKGTGQVNINPDRRTMAGWNFDRIKDTEETQGTT